MKLSPSWKATLLTAGWVLALATVIATAGCQSAPVYVDRPVPVEVERKVYVEIPRELCREQPIAEPSKPGAVSEAPEVARARKLALERANALARAVCAVRGTDVPAE